MWTTAVGLLGEDAPPDDADSDEEKINFLRIAMRQHLDEVFAPYSVDHNSMH